MIYLDHAATTPMRREVLEAMLPYFSDCYANASSSYAAARESRRAIDLARRQVARLIGAQPDEIYFTSGGSEADNWALMGVMRAARPSKNHLITTKIEHHAVLRTCHALENEQFQVTYAPVSQNGVVSSEEVASSVTPETALISVMLANNEVGTLQPVTSIADAAHNSGCLMHTDAVQAVGHVPVDVDSLKVDLLSMSAHKFGGPKGIGALYIRKGTRIDRLIHGGDQEKGLRAGTENTAAIVGMAKAAEIAENEMQQSVTIKLELRNLMIDRIQNLLPSVIVNGLQAERLPGHVHLSIPGEDSALLLMQLDMRGIAASAGSACASGAQERSHVLRAMRYPQSGHADLRFTFGENNTVSDVEMAIRALADILHK